MLDAVNTRKTSHDLPPCGRGLQGVGDEPASTEGVVVVIPAYNEERFIASVVFQARPYAEHVIVVDDGSSGRTAALAEAAGATVLR
jgi:cellulose synthase/poly-beta-1,6-N-acetylglucosamine synthase-like glycosyltransferase